MKFIKPIFLLFVIVVYFILIQQNRFIQDDAFINFRYVENFLAGNGLVFNIGENVEGFTSFSWILILTFAKIFNLDLILFSQIASITFGLLIFVILFLLSKDKKNSFLIFLISSSLLLSSGGFIYWASSGMETTFFAFLIILIFYFYLRNTDLSKNYYFFIFSFLAIITRQEAFAIFSIFIIYKYLSNKHFYSINNLHKKILLNISLMLIPLILLLVLRIYYYGYIFPNTYYAKTNLILPYFYRGIEYVVNWFRFDLFYGVLILPVFYYFIKEKNQILSIPLLLLSFYVLYNLYIGGDVLPHNRFFIPILPIIYLAVSYSIVNLKIQKQFLYLSLIFVLVLSFIKYDLQSEKINYTKQHELGLVKKMRIYAEYLNENNYKNSTAVISTIGSFGYYFQENVIDLVGLTDGFIAHNPKEVLEIDDNIPVGWKERTYNIDYIFDRTPEFIIFPAGYKPTAFPEAALFSDLRFYQNYYVQLIFDNELKQMLPIFVRRNDLLEIENTTEAHNPSWIINFINGNNLLLEFIKTKNKNLVPLIENEVEKIKLSSIRKNEANLIMGILKFHDELFQESFGYFQEIILSDNKNSIAYYYLMLISAKNNNRIEIDFYTKKLKEISPGALPNLVLIDD